MCFCACRLLALLAQALGRSRREPNSSPLSKPWVWALGFSGLGFGGLGYRVKGIWL